MEHALRVLWTIVFGISPYLFLAMFMYLQVPVFYADISFVSLLFRYLNAIQTMCPHILRYLTTAVITNKDVRKRRQVLKDLVKVIQQVSTHLFICIFLDRISFFSTPYIGKHLTLSSS